MGSMVADSEILAAKFETILPHLDERQRRLLMGAEARALGHGGIRVVARAAGVREATVSLGVDELDSGAEPLGRARRPGGGRKRAAELDPELRPALLALVEPQERGDPMSPLRWTTKSTRTLAGELTRQGHRVGADTVADLLREEGFSLQGNAKTTEGTQHPDRDAQFRYINEQVKAHQDSIDPVISVDTKKKENIGEFKNGGREWRPKGEPSRVRSHDFPDEQLGKAIPYGIYDLAMDAGWVSVGTDHDTAAFAVESIRRWWNAAGRPAYPGARRLLITADAGGSNSYRTRAWKAELAALALQTGLAVTVCHFPPGTSKWNRIEHRLFSHITMNWRGRPLTSHEVIVNTIAATTTRTGLTVRAELDPGSYDTGVKVSDEQLAGLPLDAPRPDRDAARGLDPADQRAGHPVPGPPRSRAAHRPRRPRQPQARRRVPGRAHPARDDPGHHLAGTLPPAATRPRRAVRRRHRHHRQGRAPDPAAPGPAPPRHPAGRNPSQDPRRTHRIRRRTRRHAHPGNESRALIICKR
jgi:transposase